MAGDSQDFSTLSSQQRVQPVFEPRSVIRLKSLVYACVLAAVLPVAVIRAFVFHTRPFVRHDTKEAGSLFPYANVSNLTDLAVAVQGPSTTEPDDTKEAGSLFSKMKGSNVTNFAVTAQGLTTKETYITKEAGSLFLETKGSNVTVLAGTGACDLSIGTWVPDPQPPLYTNEMCQYIGDDQNCMKNGRPDSGYLHWKWKPNDCELPRLDGRAFLESMRGKTVAFVGDSIAGNQRQSLLCILAQVEKPINTFRSADFKFTHWLFPSYSFTLSSYWSPYLVRQTDKPMLVNNSTQIVTYLDLDVLDERWASSMAGVDVVVMSSGQWYFKRGVYVEQGKVLGCHYCPGLALPELGFNDSYRKVVHAVLKGVISLPGYKGLTVFRTFAPDHFEKGKWDTGGSCPRTVPSGVPILEQNRVMHVIESEEIRKVLKEVSPANATRLKILDMTDLAQLRADGHPGPYRQYHPFSKGFVGPMIIDCLHWCNPGPIDTWNELVAETLRRANLT